MATLGVVPFSNNVTSSHANKLQIIQHSTSSVSNSDSSGHHERREILILRKKTKPVVTVTERSETVLVNSCSNEQVDNVNGVRKKVVGVGSNLPRSHHQPPPVSVARRNARERNRVKQVNNGFATLRQHIPTSVLSTYTTAGTQPGGRSNKKLSKVETLRMAVDYIRSLQQMLSMDDDSNSNIQRSRSPDSSDVSSSPSLVVHSPPSPANSSTNPSTTDLQHSYQPYEDDGVQTDPPESPIHIDDDDDISLIDPTSPSSSSTLTSHRFTPQYHRIRGIDTYIQVVNPQQINSNPEASQHYGVVETFSPAATSFPNVSRDGEYLTSEAQLHRLRTQHLVTTSTDSYHQQPSSAELVILGGGRPHVTSSLSPGDYSEQSLSPETSNVDDIPILTSASSAYFLPSFPSNLKSSPTTPHQVVISPPPLSILSPSTAVNTTSVIHQGYLANAGLLSQVKMEGQLEAGEDGSEAVIVSGGEDMMDMMAWWEQEQKLRLVTSVTTSSS